MSFSVTQSPNKVGIFCESDVCSDGLFPAPNLGKFGFKHWRFKEMFSYQTYGTLDNGDNEGQADTYWVTYQMLKQFNDHHKNKFEHGWKVTVDERIFWGWERDQPGECHKVYRKPIDFVPEYKYLSTVGVLVTTTFEHVSSNNPNKEINIPSNMVLVLLLYYIYVKLLVQKASTVL